MMFNNGLNQRSAEEAVEDDPTIDQIVGANVRQYRTGTSMAQHELGSKMEVYLGRAWPAQTVSLAEKGRRPFAVTELVALADIFAVTVTDLLDPADYASSAITLPSGSGMYLTWYLALAGPAPRTSEVDFGEVVDDIKHLAEELSETAANLRDSAQAVSSEAQGVYGRAVRVQRKLPTVKKAFDGVSPITDKDAE
ncbi:helix-turn-helix domain-containing protein [Rhodococcus pyridinivorans]|uniref:helix-turn-helix domain-containing protein n=1 Tax=Rhodococcus pyridinivorans TaxID=103816 RepID=UPI001FFF473D|nr:helix-turn-helix transcriptional regulator [Rhodococcus pyridinivorans]UPK64655.1 helix-turn-helix domain-containing protein [Rhodococcus pyridinivorans]